MKKALMASVLSIFLGVGVLFGGCGTDLSGLNSQINELKQQIASLTQTILELQTRLNQAEQNQQELLLDLTTAQGQLLELQEQVFGKSDNYKSIGETLNYVVDGFKMFELTFTNCTYDLTTAYHSVSYEFISNIPGINDITSEELNMTFIFYDNVNSTSYTVLDVTSNFKIIFSLNIPNEIRSGDVFVYLGNSLLSVYKVNFDELSS